MMETTYFPELCNSAFLAFRTSNLFASLRTGAVYGLNRRLGAEHTAEKVVHSDASPILTPSCDFEDLHQATERESCTLCN
jgi:hypothetical protein